ncbi:MAG: potassium transporter TrkA [Chloroflexi bacterium]|nr:potassium transporter TrkA [Chloroflexota bacterium]
MMKRATVGDLLRYRVDNFLSRRTIALVAALFAVTACVVLGAAATLVVAGLKPAGSAGELSFPEAVWLAATRALDPGTVADDSGWPYRLIGLLVTVGGIFLTSALISVLVSGLDQRLNELRRGRTPVVETGHTLILGWSRQIFAILHELACANRSRRGRRQAGGAGTGSRRSPCVVILAERDRLEMEEEIRLKAPDTQGTRIACRSGNPLDPDVLQIVRPETARAIIVLSPGGRYPDLPIGQAMLALASHRKRSKQGGHIVAALHNPANLEIMRMMAGEGARVFSADRLMAYLVAQACRQPGLLRVYEQLLSFQGNPIQFADVPALAGTTYGEAHHRLDNATLIGLQSADGAVQLNPPADTPLQAGGRLVVIHRDGEPIHLSSVSRGAADSGPIRREAPVPLPPDRLLLLGWNRRAPTVLEQLGHCAPPGSQVRVAAPFPIEQMQADCAGAGLGSLQVTLETASPQDRPTLERLAAADYPYIVILGPAEEGDMHTADAFSMTTFLHLRDIAQRTGRDFSILVEIADARNRDLPGITQASDEMISEVIVALVLVQIAENADMGLVLVDLFSPGGTHVFLRPAGDYVQPGAPVSFTTVMAAAQYRGETAIGYRLLSEAEQDGRLSGVHLNPDRFASISFSEQDRVIVLAKW